MHSPQKQNGLGSQTSHVPGHTGADHCCCCFCWCCSHINSHSNRQVRGHRAGSSHLEVEGYPKEITKKKHAKSGTRIHQSWRNACLRCIKYEKVKSRNQPTMCQVHTGTYTSHYARLQNDHNTACHTNIYASRIIHNYAYARQCYGIAGPGSQTRRNIWDAAGYEKVGTCLWRQLRKKWEKTRWRFCVAEF